jgi:hypothetical protein
MNFFFLSNTISFILNKYFPFDITGFEGTYTVNDVSDYDGEVDPYNLVTEAGEGDTLIATGIWGFPVPINVVLNPNDFSLNIPKQLLFVHGTYGDVFIESVNTGSFKVCDNSLSLNYTIYADAGTFDKVSSSEWVIAGKSGKISFNKNIDALQLK